MSKKTAHHTDFFWTSYTDLFTSLFFVMLVLYVITFVVLKQEQNKYKADAERLRKLQNIENAVNKIDTNYFAYRPEYKKHILKVKVQFPKGSSNIETLEYQNRVDLVRAGAILGNLILKMNEEYADQNIKYLVIVEGQASQSGETDANYKLSFERALSLLNFWKNQDVNIGEGRLENCEFVLAGSGEYGEPRENDQNDEANQRFLIHIIPKIGILK
jgi:outer membrane protein OmpA-like peptidoglycan-associated protein